MDRKWLYAIVLTIILSVTILKPKIPIIQDAVLCFLIYKALYICEKKLKKK